MSVSAGLGSEQAAVLPQGPIVYREAGEGPPLLFVHGVLTNGDLWRKVVPQLRSQFRCIVPDWPLGSHSTGMNEDADLTPPGLAQVVASFMEELDLDGVTLVGNDTGGAICQMVATGHPARLGRLVLTPCDAFENFLPLPVRHLEWAAPLPGSMFLVGQVLRVRALHRLPIAFGWLRKRPIEPEITASYVEPVRRHREVRRDLRKVLRGISPRYTREAATRLPRFDRPVLIAWAEEDRMFPLEHAERLAALFPDARLETIADSYSFVPEDQPDRLVELIRGFASTPA